ncbi:MAG TPA: hypothetical protein VM261_20780, partial [Kofleriaceae bacterium]|nr:hypothetical protein [Kofleriaceae bacterium]
MSERDERVRPSSRLAGFYQRPLAERVAAVAALAETGALSPESAAWLVRGGGLDLATADRMSENVVGIAGLPFALALNVRVNQLDHLVPMAVEEPSVVAAASAAARLVRLSGGFTGDADESIMTAQIHVDGVRDATTAAVIIREHGRELCALGDRAIPRMVERGGGCRDATCRVLDAASGAVVVELGIDVGDAMGANMVDTVAEAVAPRVEQLLGGRLGLRILSNLPMRRRVRVVAAASNAARIVRASGGFRGEADPAVMTAQVQFDDVQNPEVGAAAVLAARDELLAVGDASIPRMVERGGGCRDLEVRILDRDVGL